MPGMPTDRPNFTELAREWLVRVQGFVQPWHVEPLAKELQRMWDWGYEYGHQDGVEDEAISLDQGEES